MYPVPERERFRSYHGEPNSDVGRIKDTNTQYWRYNATDYQSQTGIINKIH